MGCKDVEFVVKTHMKENGEPSMKKKFPKKYTGFFILQRKCVNLSEKYVGPWFSFIFTNYKWILSSTYRPETYLPKRPVDLGRKPHEVEKPKHFKQK